MAINGVMIDCSRLLERHEYYFRLIDFMAEWKANLLVFHFTDDYGLAVALPGFKDIAMRHAFTPREVKQLVAYAAERGIDVVPEVETFGHIRYLTDHKKYRHLYAGKNSRDLNFNAIDPLNPESKTLMRRLLRETVKLFPSRYLHLGCDEVNLTEYCERHPGLDPDRVWCDYANSMIGMAHDLGKTPIIWADHPVKSPRIAGLLRKDVIAAWWNYLPRPAERDLRGLQRAGFAGVLNASSVASHGYRFLPPEWALRNNDWMSRYAKKHRTQGVLNTIWCPWRYPQGAMYYGIAYGAETFRAGGRLNRNKFNEKFVRKVFGAKLTPELSKYLRGWTAAEFTAPMAAAVDAGETGVGTNLRRQFAVVNRVWRETRELAADFAPRKNADVWAAMRLALAVTGLCTEWFLLAGAKAKNAKRKAAYNALLAEVRDALDRDWDQTRYPDDPLKCAGRFTNWNAQNMMLLVGKLPVFS